MFCFIITAQEIADYKADMLEMAGEYIFPTDEEMEEMFSLACVSVGWRPQDCKCVHWGYYHEGEE